MAAKTVAVAGKEYTAEQIQAGKVEISEGSFIVGVHDGKKASLLKEMKEGELQWEPKMPFSDGMPMFAGLLDQAKILWLLAREEVKYVEADGVVTICEK